MAITRRQFCKQSLLTSLALSTGIKPQEASAKAKSKFKRAKRVLIISFDGISVDGFKQARTPNLDALMFDGCLSLETRDVMPSITLPNYTSHLLGAGPEVHGVVDNGWKPGKYILPALVTDEDGYFPSVFKVLKDNVPNIKTGFFWNWYNLIYPINEKHIDEQFYDKDENNYPLVFDKAFDFMQSHKHEPTCLFLYSVHTDEVGHKYGWMTPEYIKSLEDGDVQVGILIKKMKEVGIYDDTHIIYISDHGGIGHGHGGFTTDEMVVPWGIKGPGIKKGIMITEPNNTVNTASTVLRLFGVEQPACWTGEVPESIFK